jgi:hypothetical protein
VRRPDVVADPGADARYGQELVPEVNDDSGHLVRF